VPACSSGKAGPASTSTSTAASATTSTSLAEPASGAAASSTSATPTTPAPSTTAAPAAADTSQRLTAPGFGYLTVRDGVTLSINVKLPGTVDNGPYPTVVEYSGYDPSNPDNTINAQMFNAFGYAYVGINMRGTGCSGGAFSFFGADQLNDGYDAVEIVAAQPWVKHHHVGLVGISYSGISQLFVASTRPPHLAAIAPLAVFDDAYRSTLYPGGMLNTGFAVEWTAERVAEAQPFGQAWTKQRADKGDTVCAKNQEARSGNVDLTTLITDNPYYDPTLADTMNPSLLVDRIDVPVFIAGAWQDEQTGGRWPVLLDRFASAPHVFATLTNGLHTEGLSMGVLERYYEFLDLYVAERVPGLRGMASLIPTVLYNAIFGATGIWFPPTRFEDMTYQQAKAAYEAEPAVRILFEEGAAEGLRAGSPVARFAQGFASWPIPSTEPTALPLVSAKGRSTYTYDPDAVPDTFYSGSLADIWKANVQWDWKPAPKGAVVAFEGKTLSSDTVLVGPASADLWITSSTPDTDIEVTITEVRPDGNEVYVQSGWLRASQRAIDAAASTELRPMLTQLESDAAPLVVGEPTLVRVEILPFGHVFRKGSRIRVIVGSPGGNRAQWHFENLPGGGTVSVLTDSAHPSRVMLPVVPGISVPAEYPACGALRGQPCRKYIKLG